MTVELNGIDPGTEHTSLTARTFIKMLSPDVGWQTQKQSSKKKKTAAKRHLMV